MTLVTVSRQMGSHGARIARALAKELGWTFADKSSIDPVLRKYGLAKLSMIYDEPPSIWELFDEDSTTTVDMLDRTMKAIAARGDTVLLGRGGFQLFAGYADVLHVFIKAPLERRAQRIARRDAMPMDDAVARVKADDAMRAKFVRMFYGKDWAKESQFNLVIDTAETSDEEAIARIREALAGLPTGAAGAPTTAGIRVDPVLDSTLTEVFGAS